MSNPPPKQPYRIWLKDLADRNEDWDEKTVLSVGHALIAYFSQIAARSSQFGPVSLSWNPSTNGIRDHELLAYILPHRGESIIAGHTREALGPTGTTFPTRTGVISEVYLDALVDGADRGKRIANVVFHHLMHNKLEPAVVKDIHTLGGGGLAIGLPLLSTHSPTPENFSLMARGLGRANPQYQRALSERIRTPGRT